MTRSLPARRTRKAFALRKNFAEFRDLLPASGSLAEGERNRARGASRREPAGVKT